MTDNTDWKRKRCRWLRRPTPLCALSTEALAPSALWPPTTTQLNSAVTPPQGEQTSEAVACRLWSSKEHTRSAATAKSHDYFP